LIGIGGDDQELEKVLSVLKNFIASLLSFIRSWDNELIAPSNTIKIELLTNKVECVLYYRLRVEDIVLIT